MIWRAIAIFLLLAGVCFAQEGDTPPAPEPDPLDGFLDDVDNGTLPPPEIVFLDLLDEDGKLAMKAALKEYYRYHETGFIHRRAVFNWQLFSSRVIFAIVILLVLIGVYFSWLQFMAGARAAPPPDSESGLPAPKDGKKTLVTTIEASLQGIKVSSPVLGVVILVISLAFFYLYLVHVYPIVELF